MERNKMRHFSGEFPGLRLLMEDELLEIAGGEGEDTDSGPPPTEVEEIVVNGQYLPPQFYYSPPIITGGGGYDATGDGAGPEDDYPDTPDTPCVETAFASSAVSVDRVNNAAKAAADAIAATGHQNSWEYGAFIYEYGGHVLFTPPFTNQSYDHVDFSSAALPPGAHVLGIIHNHPYSTGDVDQRYPSTPDWNIYNQLAGLTVGDKTFDANMLSYITTNQDGSVRPYDNTDKNQNSPSCGF
jgi:hypothetical protein